MSLGRVLITGGGGQLATDLGELLAAPDVVVRGRDELDITDTARLDAAFEEIAPEVVFNCAAFHNLDVCEREPERALAVNVTAVAELAKRTAATGAQLVHLSTNYVFGGSASEAYTETDLPRPLSIYAISKTAGEYAARAYDPGALVVRAAGLYGRHGSHSKGGNFIQRVLERARNEGRVRMVADQRLSPTFTADLAPALVEAVEAGVTGTLHLAASGECTWYEFTLAALEIAGVDVPVEAVPTTWSPGQVRRPLNGVLARGAADRAGLTSLRPWREALQDYMERAGLTARAQVPGR